MKPKVKIAMLILVISGCATKLPPQIVYNTVEVEVPVYQSPKFDIPKKPLLPVDALNWSHIDDHNVIGKAYVITIQELRTHVEQLHNLLEGIKKGEDE